MMFNQFFMSRESEIRFFFTLFLVLSLFLVTSYVLGSRVRRDEMSVPTKVAHVFPQVELRAKSAYVYDARTQSVLYAKNEDQRLSLASLTKLMAALVAREISPRYGTVTVTSDALKVEGDSGLMANERWSLGDLLDFSLISSSNDGIRAVALSLGALESFGATEEEVVGDFVKAMNSKALELGLKNTYFWNETGLDESAVKGGGYGTAQDVARLLEYILSTQPDLLEATRAKEAVIVSIDNNAHVAKNTNQIASDTPGLIGSKTGYTDTAGGNLAFVFDPELGRPIIITVLGSTASGRFEDAKKLINATLQYINGGN
jgi:serine-type D-Ala-D-Ala carboxypeptidase (penicillin-binding protein 5/6)